MRWSEIPFSPPVATLRWFAFLGALLLAAAAVWLFLNHQNEGVALVLLALASVVGALGFAFPKALRPVFVAWMVLVFPIGWLTTQLILALLFYCIFTPLGLWFRLIGRDGLACRLRPDQETYWTAKPPAADVRSYFRQS
ncbi:MAG TPA: SxtJ family membrane protein [Gemmataceae bacterium]|nr:SxtJ family membrane protein [Gemmataceae bacterium]